MQVVCGNIFVKQLENVKLNNVVKHLVKIQLLLL
jgi:hypothetical protein